MLHMLCKDTSLIIVSAVFNVKISKKPKAKMRRFASRMSWAENVRGFIERRAGG
ncbi:MAG: hypothetical protein QXM71_05550 [Thermofilum sp.]